MSTNQLFFSLVTVMALFAGFFKYYIDAKTDPIKSQVDLLVKYMIDHEGKIARLEERVK